MIDDNNHSEIFVSENNRYCIKCDNKSIYVKTLNEFKDIKKYYGINVYYKINEITDNYYKVDKPSIIRNCTILLMDEDNHSKIFISEKNSYYIRNNFDDSYNVNGYDYFNSDIDGYRYFDEDYVEYDYYDDDYDYDDYYEYYFDDNYNYYDYDDDGYDELVCYKKPLNYFERWVSVKNNIVNAVSNDDYNKDIKMCIKLIATIYY